MDDHQIERAPARARVKFGPKPHQTIPFEYAERIMMALGRKPKELMKYLAPVVTEDLGGDSTPGGGE